MLRFRTTLVALGIVLAFGGAAYWWLILDGAVPDDAAPYPIDIGAVRALNAATPGDRPIEIRVEHVLGGSFPAAGLIAGAGWEPLPIDVFSYQLIYPEETLIIDTAMTGEMGGSFLPSFDRAAFDRMHTAIARADTVLLTHEHLDHIGGLLAFPDQAPLRPSLILTDTQMSGMSEDERQTLLDGLNKGASTPDDRFEPLAYDIIYSVAPGVVLIESPGHSVGSQMIYVKMANGREVLFLGDVVWHWRSIEEMAGRPRAMSLLLREDRDLIFSEMVAVRDLSVAEPDIVMIPGHDAAAVERLVDEGALSNGFQVD